MTTTAKTLLLGATLALTAIGCKHKHADLILTNALVHTMDSAGTVAQAVAIQDGKIVAVGGTDDILFEYAADSIWDLKGLTVLPGIIDAHCHYVGYAKNLRRANLVGTLSWEGVLTVMDSVAVAQPEGWLLGRGWDQNDWADKSFPDNSALNIRFPDRPVLLIRIDGHAAIANQAALDIAGITARTRVTGGKVQTDRAGRPTGLLIDNAVELVSKHIPPLTDAQTTEFLQRSQTELFAHGITTVSDAGLDLQEILLLDSLQKAGLLKMRVYAMANPTQENLERFGKSGPYRTERLSVSAFKVYADGALGSRGACLLEPYKDDPETQGLMLHDLDYYRSIAKTLRDAGFQMNTHCIGDSAVRFILHVYGEVLGGPNNRRWRIEHAQVVNQRDFELFDQHDIIPSVQPIMAISDMPWAEDRIGKTRLEGAYAFRTLFAQNKTIAFGTDFPVEPVNPFLGLHAATQRMDTNGFPHGGFIPTEAVGIDTALRAMTIWAAYANMEEQTKGSIEPGKHADLIILPQDPYAIDPKLLHRLQVAYTLISGKVVFQRDL